MNDQSMRVRQMFSLIAARYDRLNRMMTFGTDLIFRREVIKRLNPLPGRLYLDDGAGTGDFSKEILSHSPSAKVVALDFTGAMIRQGKKSDLSRQIIWIQADAQSLPFKSDVVDGSVSGFLLRNAQSIDDVLREQMRVLKPGTVSINLDTTPPQKNFLYPFILFYLRIIIPIMGLLFSGNKSAYSYLSQSTEGFLTPDQLAERFRLAGFSSITWAYRLFGSLAIHQAKKR